MAVEGYLRLGEWLTNNLGALRTTPLTPGRGRCFRWGARIVTPLVGGSVAQLPRDSKDPARAATGGSVPESAGGSPRRGFRGVRPRNLALRFRNCMPTRESVGIS